MISYLKKHIIRPIVNSASPDLCEHILDKALIEKWDVKKIHEPFIIDLPIPRGCEDDPNAFATFTAHQRTGFQAQYLVCIPKGIAAGGGFVRLTTGEFITESSWRMEWMLGNVGADIYKARFRKHKLHLKGDLYYLDSFCASNYGHWFLDDLPRLISALPHLPPSTRFILSDPVQEFKVKSLAVFGIFPERLIPIKGYYETHCERLWFATQLGSCAWASTSPEVFRNVSCKIKRHYFETDCDSPERIFISRENAAHKRLVNEKNLLKIIKEFGFTIVHAEKLSFAEQVKTFSKAKHALAAHGGGITNIIFSPISSHLMELQDSRYAPRRWFWKVLTMLGHDYSSLIGKTLDDRYEGDADFLINEDKLREFLEVRLSEDTRDKSNQWWKC